MAGQRNSFVCSSTLDREMKKDCPNRDLARFRDKERPMSILEGGEETTATLALFTSFRGGRRGKRPCQSGKGLGKLALLLLSALDVVRLANRCGLDEAVRRRFGRVFYSSRGSSLTCAMGLLASGSLSDGLSTIGRVDIDVRSGGLAHTLGLGSTEHDVVGGVLAGGRRLGNGALVGRVSQRSLLLTSAQTGGGTSVRDDGTGLAIVELLLELWITSRSSQLSI
jgi:hypothetical protein